MDSCATLELTYGSTDTNFTGNYQNGQRGYSAPALGRSSSFREGSESRNLGSVKINSRVSAKPSRDVPTLSQCLIRDPISKGDSKSGRTANLKRIFSFFVGINSEDNSFGSMHLKHSTAGLLEDLKRVRSSVADTCVKASARVQMLDERLSMLNKYIETSPLKQQLLHLHDISTNERSGIPKIKTGMQMDYNTPEPSQKYSDSTKNLCPSKHARTSTMETRAECKNSGTIRNPLMLTKDRGMLKDNDADFNVRDEKMRRLPAGDGGLAEAGTEK